MNTVQRADMNTTSQDGLLALSSIPQRALVRVLAVAHRKRMEPGALVRLLGAEFEGAVGARMQHFATLLQSGTPIAQALEQTPGILDPSGVMAIRLASETGTLGDIYDALLSDEGLETESSESDWRNPRAEFVRVAMGFVVAWFILTFLMIFIMPTFQYMFEEFGLELPAITSSLISVSNHGGKFFLVGMLVFAILFLVRAVFFGESRPHRFNPLRWHERFVPPSVSLLSLLAIVVDSGRPLAAGLATLAKCHHVPKTRQQLASTCRRIDGGESPWMALSAEGILTTDESRALSVTTASDAQAWLLRWLAGTRQNKRLFRRHLLTRFVSLLSLLMLAIVVSWAAIGVFVVLVELVRGLS